MRIYTTTGDRGRTSLFSGERISKSHSRVEAYGDVDELNAVLGTLVAALRSEAIDEQQELLHIQRSLFHIGAWLATTPDSPSIKMLQHISEQESTRLEEAIDRMQAALPELHSFILPGGHMASAFSHVARTVCRRAERHIVALYEQEESVSEREHFLNVMLYLNRLSDFLFVFARYCNMVFGKGDILWSSEE